MAGINFNSPPSGFIERINWCVSAIQSLYRRLNGTNTSSGGGVTNVSSANIANATIATPTTTPVISIISAPKLQTARNINGTAFDGTADITIASQGVAGGDLTGTYPNPTLQKITSTISSYNGITTDGLGTSFIVKAVLTPTTSTAGNLLVYAPQSSIATYEIKGICDVASGSITTIILNYTDENGNLQGVRFRGITGNTSATVIAGGYTSTYNLLFPITFRASNATPISVVTTLTTATYNANFILLQLTSP